MQRSAAKPKNGWTVHPGLSHFSKANPLSRDEAKEKFQEALAAGIQKLKTFKAGYMDGGGTEVGIQIGGKLTKTSIPMFLHEDEPDNKGSENHKRFLEVQKIIGKFDADPVEKDKPN